MHQKNRLFVSLLGVLEAVLIHSSQISGILLPLHNLAKVGVRSEPVRDARVQLATKALNQLAIGQTGLDKLLSLGCLLQLNLLQGAAQHLPEKASVLQVAAHCEHLAALGRHGTAIGVAEGCAPNPVRRAALDLDVSVDVG